MSKPLVTGVTFPIYTARYSNRLVLAKEYAPVRITVGAPRFKLPYHLVGEIPHLAPVGKLFKIFDRAKFEPAYHKHLDAIGADTIRDQLQDIYDREGRSPVLLCFERVDAGNWCHRLCFATWWKKRTGQDVLELEEPFQPTDAKKPPAKKKKKTPYVEELRLF